MGKEEALEAASASQLGLRETANRTLTALAAKLPASLSDSLAAKLPASLAAKLPAWLTTPAAHPKNQPDQPKRVLHVAVIGDSYSSGTGSMGAPSGLDTETYLGYYGDKGRAGRSPYAYGKLYANWLAKQGLEVTYTNLAYQGAEIEDYEHNIMSQVGLPRSRNFAPVPKTKEDILNLGSVRNAVAVHTHKAHKALERRLPDRADKRPTPTAQTGVPDTPHETLPEDTDIVLFTAGGNDICFTPIVTHSFVPVFRSPAKCIKDFEHAREVLPKITISTWRLLRAIEAKIATDKPALAIFVGYPLMSLPINDYSIGKTPDGEDYYIAPKVREIGIEARLVQEKIVADWNARGSNLRVEYINLNDLFAGHEPNPDPWSFNPERWINEPGETAGQLADDGSVSSMRAYTPTLAMNWFHPNRIGYEKIAEQIIKQIGVPQLRKVPADDSRRFLAKPIRHLRTYYERFFK